MKTPNSATKTLASNVYDKKAKAKAVWSRVQMAVAYMHNTSKNRHTENPNTDMPSTLDEIDFETSFQNSFHAVGSQNSFQQDLDLHAQASRERLPSNDEGTMPLASGAATAQSKDEQGVAADSPFAKQSLCASHLSLPIAERDDMEVNDSPSSRSSRDIPATCSEQNSKTHRPSLLDDVPIINLDGNELHMCAYDFFLNLPVHAELSLSLMVAPQALLHGST